MPTLELIAEIQFLKTQLAQCQERLAVAEGLLRKHLDVAYGLPGGGYVHDCEIETFLSHAPSDWMAVQRDKLTTILNRWDALELDLAIRYGGVEAIPELVDAKKSIKAALEGLGR